MGRPCASRYRGAAGAVTSHRDALGEGKNEGTIGRACWPCTVSLTNSCMASRAMRLVVWTDLETALLSSPRHAGSGTAVGPTEMRKQRSRLSSARRKLTRSAHTHRTWRYNPACSSTCMRTPAGPAMAARACRQGPPNAGAGSAGMGARVGARTCRPAPAAGRLRHTQP